MDAFFCLPHVLTFDNFVFTMICYQKAGVVPALHTPDVEHGQQGREEDVEHDQQTDQA